MRRIHRARPREPQRARLFDSQEILTAAVVQDDGCRGDPNEEHHRYDSRRQPAHQLGLVVAVAAFVAAVAGAVTTFVTAAFIASAGTGAFAATFVSTFVATAAFAAAFAVVAVTVVTRRFVLVEACASRTGANSTSPRQRATGAECQKRNRQKCRQTLLHERSFARGLSLVMAMAGLAAMLWLVVVASFASPAAFATAGTLVFTALTFAAVTFVAATSFALFASMAFAGFAFVRLFPRAFVLKMTAFTVYARWRFWFFTGAFVGNARAFTVHARRFVLVKARAARHLAGTAAGQCKRAASAKHEESNCRKCGEATPHRRPSLPGGARTSGNAHRAQLYSI